MKPTTIKYLQKLLDPELMGTQFKIHWQLINDLLNNRSIYKYKKKSQRNPSTSMGSLRVKTFRREKDSMYKRPLQVLERKGIIIKVENDTGIRSGYVINDTCKPYLTKKATFDEIASLGRKIKKSSNDIDLEKLCKQVHEVLYIELRKSNLLERRLSNYSAQEYRELLIAECKALVCWHSKAQKLSSACEDNMDNWLKYFKKRKSKKDNEETKKQVSKNLRRTFERHVKDHDDMLQKLVAEDIELAHVLSFIYPQENK